MADSDEVCGCNGVTKGTICKAIKDKGLFTLDEVRKHTKASASCGSCTGPCRADLLMFTAGGDLPKPRRRRRPMCGCNRCQPRRGARAIRATKAPAEHPRGDLPDAGLAHAERLREVPAGDQLLPDQHLAERGLQDDPQSRFINERSHANIQKDGTYSVCPRMGRRDHHASCAAIADAVDNTRSRRSRSPAASASTCSA